MNQTFCPNLDSLSFQKLGAVSGRHIGAMEFQHSGNGSPIGVRQFWVRDCGGFRPIASSCCESDTKHICCLFHSGSGRTNLECLLLIKRGMS
jgi:hypothetical protein